MTNVVGWQLTNLSVTFDTTVWGTSMVGFKFHHVGVAVRDMQGAIPIYADLFGYELISGPFDDPIQNVSVCFLSRGGGDAMIEFCLLYTSRCV